MFIALIVLIIISVLLFLGVSSILVFSCVSGSSMNPTLKDKDWIVCCRDAKYRRGDIILFFRGQHKTFDRNRILVKGRKQVYIKRIIAFAGEEINIKNGTVYINGTELEEEYLPSHIKTVSLNNNPITIPKGFVFVMGDNRNHSIDSRSASFGLVNEDNIIATCFSRVITNDEYGAIK